MIYDSFVKISTGKSRKETRWKNKEIKYSDLVKMLSETTRTKETHDEYQKMNKTDRDNIKDVGGFVGGSLKNGRRKAENIIDRTLITLDLDSVTEDVWAEIQTLWGFSCLIYSTHSHSSKAPRLRLVIPLARPVSPDEYQAISRWLANEIGIEQFDITTYQPFRLMYWPSTSIDEEFIFKIQDLAWLNPDDILSKYTYGWKNVENWPTGVKDTIKIESNIKKQEDPLTKKGLVGAFCRTYSISAVINKFLGDIYETTGTDDRYTYIKGSTFGGMVIYNDVFAFSHHGTDPASHLTCNAFDLVRIHKFGNLDEDMKEGTPKSFKKMIEFIMEDEEVKFNIEDSMSFTVIEDSRWEAKLEINNLGKNLNTPRNFLLFITNHEAIKDKLAYNEFSNRIIVKSQLPWRKEGDLSEWKDIDESCLRNFIYMEKQMQSKPCIDDALKEIIFKNSFHPIKDYLQGLEWDGIKRIDTLLIDYLGAKDTKYTRIVTRKWLCGAVARVKCPGIKFDYILTLTGPQGSYKSTFFRKLGKEDWFTDSLTSTDGDQAIDKISGAWIIEFGEMQAYNKSEINSVKRFTSSVEDRRRIPYDRYTSYFKRQCVFCGSTNKTDFLKDNTGDRRFWPVEIYQEGRTKSVKDGLESEVDQIWAEACAIYDEGKETLYLTEEEERLAINQQEEHREVNEKEGIVREYLEKFLPSDWDEMNVNNRREFLEEGVFEGRVGTVKREKVCVLEIWCEYFGYDAASLKRSDSLEINSILSQFKDWKKANGMFVFKIYGKQRYFKLEQTEQS